MMVSMKNELRKRTHDLMRAELSEAAFAHMVEYGYDACTSDDLAKALGISRATFFRYLGSKDEVVVAAMLEPVSQFRDAYEQAVRPVGGSEWDHLREALEPAVLLADTDPTRQRSRLQLIRAHPALGAKLRRARAPQIDDLADALVACGHDSFAAHVLATASIAVLDQCWSQWSREKDASLRAILDRAFEELKTAGDGLRDREHRVDRH